MLDRLPVGCLHMASAWRALQMGDSLGKNTPPAADVCGKSSSSKIGGHPQVVEAGKEAQCILSMLFTQRCTGDAALHCCPCAGGGKLAEKLIDIYFTLFKLILEGRLGHAAEVKQHQEQKQAQPQHNKHGRGRPKGKTEPSRMR